MNPELILLVADKNMEAGLDGLLSRRKKSLGLADFSYEVHVHPRHDPGCYQDGAVLLHGLIGEANRYGLLVFDFAWDGNPHSNAAETEAAVRKIFRKLGIEERTEVVVIDPELEIWVWSASPHVEDVLGWKGSTPPLRSWLCNQGLWGDDRPKPQDPKRAMEGALYEKRIPRSSSLYRQLAEKVGLTTCRDASLQRIVKPLRGWFPAK